MSRNIINDKLMAHQFHLLDVDWSMSFPPWVLSPSAGFAGATMPEMTATTETIKEGTDPFPHHVITGGEANTITLSKGVAAFNSDFWRWMTGCLMGEGAFDGNVADFLRKTATAQAPPIPGKRRNMMLMHFTGISPEGMIEAVNQGGSAMDKIKSGLLLSTGGAVSTVAQGVKAATQGLIDVGITSVPGKVFMLFGCLPVRYKPGSDFDATSSEVSVEELDISFHRFEEFGLMA